MNAIFTIFFIAKNLDVICVRPRFCRILLDQKEVLYDYYINQQRSLIFLHDDINNAMAHFAKQSKKLFLLHAF